MDVKMHTLQRPISHDAMEASRVLTLLMSNKPLPHTPSPGSLLYNTIVIWQYKIWMYGNQLKYMNAVAPR